MTTRITVSANGPCYPARLTKTDKDGSVVEELMISSGFTFETWAGPGQTVSVTEEYHPDGYPPARSA